MPNGIGSPALPCLSCQWGLKFLGMRHSLQNFNSGKTRQANNPASRFLFSVYMFVGSSEAV